MARDSERLDRAAEAPLVGSLPDAPGILAAMRLSEGLGSHLRGLADELLVKTYPGATLAREEREMIATIVSASNDCFYCMDSHGAFASELMRRAGDGDADAQIDAIKCGQLAGLSPKMKALGQVARTITDSGRALSGEHVANAKAAGATDGDVQLAVLIASAFCMYNRMVDGLRARTPQSAQAYNERAKQIADGGYQSPQLKAVPK